MARKVRDRTIDSKAARRVLAPRAKPYYRALGQGLHLGFRKGLHGGSWVARIYAGRRAYVVEKIGTADDDMNDADGIAVLDFGQAVERARRAQAERANPSGEVAAPYTVRRAVEDYLADQERLGKRSAYDARRRAETLILPELGRLDVARLTAERIERWHAALADRAPRWRSSNPDEPLLRPFDASDEEAVRRRRSSANRTLTILKAALNSAFRRGKVASDAAWRRVRAFREVDAARVRYLTVAEARRVIKAADPHFRHLVEAALATGCRYGELCRLQVADFDGRAGTVTVRRSKSGKPRHVYLTDEGRALFARLTRGRNPSDPTLVTAAGTAWGASHQIRPMAEAVSRAKIDPPISFHGLRHTYASLAVMNGTPLQVVARNLGHADTRMVEKHYGHLSTSFVADAIRTGAPRFGNARSARRVGDSR